MVAAAVLNDMKSDLSEDEFKNIVVELANRFKNGGVLDEAIFNLQYWKR